MSRLLLVCEAPVVLVALLMVCGLRVNVSPSIPLGAYWQKPISTKIDYGEIVILHVEGRTLSLAKPVRGLPGDEVCHRGGALWIRGVNYGPVLDTWQGQPLPSAVAEDCCVVVPPAHIFLATTHEYSFDSRYFGSIPVARLQGLLQPLWTWREMP